MTVENILNLLVSNPNLSRSQKLDAQSLANMSAAHLQATSGHISIPGDRRRHQSWGSTGGSSGKSSPLSGSPPLQDLISLQLQFPAPAGTLVSTRTTRLERSLSASVADQSNASQKNVNPTRYKTEMCRPFEESGHCKYGDKCQFAHGRHELRNVSRHPKYKTELCRTYHTVGFCPYGPRCHFIHNEDEMKLSEITQLKHQQMMQQVAQHVVQRQQVLSRMALTQQVHYTLHDKAPVAFIPANTVLPSASTVLPSAQTIRPTSLDFSSISLGSNAESTSSSLSDTASPSISPTGMLCDDVFGGIPTPPPGFTSLPSQAPTQRSSTSNMRREMYPLKEVAQTTYPTYCVKNVSSSAYSPIRSSTPVDVVDAPRSPASNHSDAPSPSTSPIRLPIFSRLSIDN